MEEQEVPARSKTLQRKHIRQLAKTEMCKFFLSNRCGKGLRCTYAHSITEIRSKPDLWKTSMCKEFLQTGNCEILGCTFAHDERELCTTREFFKTKMCRFASSGRCKHGAACRFAHEIEELPPAYRAAALAEMAAEGACYERGHPGTPSSMESNEVPSPPPPPGMQPGEGLTMEQRGCPPASGASAGGGSNRGSGVGGTSDWGDTIFGSDYNAASSDQSTRADTSARTPEGSGDSGQEEASNSPSFESVRGRGGGGHETVNEIVPVGGGTALPICCTASLRRPAALRARSVAPSPSGSGSGWSSCLAKSRRDERASGSREMCTSPRWSSKPTLSLSRTLMKIGRAHV